MMRRIIFVKAIVVIMGLIILGAVSGCDDKTTNPVLDYTASDDAAEVIAGNIAYQTGGTVDQMADLCLFATPDGLTRIEEKYPNTYFIFQKIYNPDSQEWEIHIERERGIAGYVPYAFYSRDYRLQFLNAQGFPQQYYIAGGDTARTISFDVLEGSGIHKTHRISQQLNELTAQWTVSNAHQDNVTINGNYYRAAVDTISVFNRMRSSDHNLQLNIVDVVVPRDGDTLMVDAISGNISGHFHADIVFISGANYSENTVDRDINITFGGGRANIALAGRNYMADLMSGELIQ